MVRSWQPAPSLVKTLVERAESPLPSGSGCRTPASPLGREGPNGSWLALLWYSPGENLFCECTWSPCGLQSFVGQVLFSFCDPMVRVSMSLASDHCLCHLRLGPYHKDQRWSLHLPAPSPLSHCQDGHSICATQISTVSCS